MNNLMKKYYPWSVGIPRTLAINLGTLFGLGNLKAPGTWGSIAGVAFYIVLFSNMDLFRYTVFALLFAYIAFGICDAAERFLGQKDSPQIILDEFVAIPICFIPLDTYTFNWWGILLGFALFRFFDIKKPWIINRIQNLEGGAGIVLDDLLAAAFTCASLNVLALFFSNIVDAY